MDNGMEFTERNSGVHIIPSPPEEGLTVELQEVQGGLEASLQRVDGDATIELQETGKKSDEIGDVHGRQVIGFDNANNPTKAIRKVISEELKIPLNEVSDEMVAKVKCRPRLDQAGNPATRTWVRQKWDPDTNDFKEESDITDHGSGVFTMDEYLAYDIEVDIYIEGRDEPIRMTYTHIGAQIVPQGEEWMGRGENWPNINNPADDKKVMKCQRNDGLQVQQIMKGLTIGFDKTNEYKPDGMSDTDYQAEKKNERNHLTTNRNYDIKIETSMTEKGSKALNVILLGIPGGVASIASRIFSNNSYSFETKEYTYKIENHSVEAGANNTLTKVKRNLIKTNMIGVQTFAIIHGANYGGEVLNPGGRLRSPRIYRGKIKGADPRESSENKEIKANAQASNQNRADLLKSAQDEASLQKAMKKKEYDKTSDTLKNIPVDDYMRGLKDELDKDVFNFNYISNALNPKGSFSLRGPVGALRAMKKKREGTSRGSIRDILKSTQEITKGIENANRAIEAGLKDMHFVQEELRSKLGQLKDMIEQGVQHEDLPAMYESCRAQLEANNQQAEALKGDLIKAGFSLTFPEENTTAGEFETKQYAIFNYENDEEAFPAYDDLEISPAPEPTPEQD